MHWTLTILWMNSTWAFGCRIGNLINSLWFFISRNYSRYCFPSLNRIMLVRIQYTCRNLTVSVYGIQFIIILCMSRPKESNWVSIVSEIVKFFSETLLPAALNQHSFIHKIREDLIPFILCFIYFSLFYLFIFNCMLFFFLPS